MNVSYTERALEDLETGLGWYTNISIALGEEFLDAIEAKVNYIQDNPKSYQVAYKHFRAAFLQKFPFSLVYSIEDKSIIIHAVFDNRQEPSKRPL